MSDQNRIIWVASALLAGSLGLATACSGDDETDDNNMMAANNNTATNNNTDANNNTSNNNTEQTLYERLGEEAGITTVMEDFVSRVVEDPSINGYFLNAGGNPTRLVLCLAKQVGSLTGGPQTYPGDGDPADSDGCRNMKESHDGLGISQTEFDDLAAHLVEALGDAGVVQADIDTIVGAVAPTATDIVEDADNNATIYQRVGRKGAIQTVIGDFLGRVLEDPAINGYFLNDSLDAPRLSTCLVRQVCGLTGGPCAYGAGIEAELDRDGDGTPEPCADMLSVHENLGISQADYDDLAAHLVTSLSTAGVAQADIDTIATVLTSTAFVNDIVEDSENNGTIYQRVGRKGAVNTVIVDFIGRVVADPAINGYFLNDSLDAERLTVCLVRQVCGLTGGPCVYGAGVEEALDRNGDGTVEPCADMLSVHENLGISQADYDDLATHLVTSLTEAGALQADIDVIVAALTAPAFVGDIVEDADNNATVYQRVGRKPAIDAVVSDFITRVVGNAEINGFFGATDAARLQTCLVRQVCDIDGPCVYGGGVEPELNGNVCRDMVSSHMNLVDDQNSPITIEDWNALVGDLVSALDAAGVATADRDAIIGALAPLCGDIVADGTTCP